MILERCALAASVIILTVAAVCLADEKTLYPVKSGDKWGYIDEEGTTIVAARFDHAGPFKEGLALVVRNKVFSFIDTTGAVRFDSPCSADVQPFSGGRAWLMNA
jgi:hypothetical protein